MSGRQVLVLTHGDFGKELLRSAEMIIGPLKNVRAFSLVPEMSAEEYKEEVEEHLSGQEGEIISLVDLFGGTPCNTIMYLSQQYPMSIISGVNLPMLLELYMNIEMDDKQQLIALALDTLQESGKNVTQLLENK